MALPNAYAQYKNSRILTASPAELTLMLYEGAIKYCNIGMTAIEQKDIPKAHANIMKVQKIIEHFRLTLDMSYPVAEDFERIYLYLEERLVYANVKKDIEILQEVHGHLSTLRDTWKEVMRLSKTHNTGEVIV